MAYTLQMGREAMEYRMAFIAQSQQELRKELVGYVDGNPAVSILTGRVTTITSKQTAVKELVQSGVSRQSLQKIAALWVKGLNIKWEQIYGDNTPYRISLPTYPFAKEHYWLPDNDMNESSRISGWLHPLLHQNNSNFAEEKFSATFSGREFFLKDHLIKGRKVLPGVADLEMARAAVSFAYGAGATDGKTSTEPAGIKLKNVVWARPMVVGEQPLKVEIRLFPQNGSESKYEIFSEFDGAEVLYSQGTAAIKLVSQIPELDLKLFGPGVIEPPSRQNNAMKFTSPPELIMVRGHRGIETIFTGDEEALAKLALPVSVYETREQFILHPSLMDAALKHRSGCLEGMPIRLIIW